MNSKLSLIPIDRDGSPRGYTESLSAVVAEVCRALSGLYAKVGFEEPWIGYLARAGDTLVGTCSFKSKPENRRVEIAYFTFPGFEGRGIATEMARTLMVMARQHDSAVVLAAQTLPQRNPSHRILEKLGFRHVDTVEHPEDGTVWEWHLVDGTETGRPGVLPPDPGEVLR